MDKIKEDFLIQMNALADEAFLKKSLELNQLFESRLPEIVGSFHVCMSSTLEQFFRLYERGDVGSLSWIYISYLRSAALSCEDSFRIDCYDSKNRISSVECAQSWDFSFVWLAYKEICLDLKEKFEKQTKVKMYEFDFIRLKVADDCYGLTRKFFPSVLGSWLQEYGTSLLAGHNIMFMTGEFLDWFEFIVRWDRECPVWELENTTED